MSLLSKSLAVLAITAATVIPSWAKTTNKASVNKPYVSAAAMVNQDEFDSDPDPCVQYLMDLSKSLISRPIVERLKTLDMNAEKIVSSEHLKELLLKSLVFKVKAQEKNAANTAIQTLVTQLENQYNAFLIQQKEKKGDFTLEIFKSDLEAFQKKTITPLIKHCYETIKKSKQSLPQASFRLCSDHSTVLMVLLPAKQYSTTRG